MAKPIILADVHQQTQAQRLGVRHTVVSEYVFLASQMNIEFDPGSVNNDNFEYGNG